MGSRSLKITKTGPPFTNMWGTSYPHESRRFLWGGDEYDAATIGACWACRSISGKLKKYFVEEHKRWGRNLPQFKTDS